MNLEKIEEFLRPEWRRFSIFSVFVFLSIFILFGTGMPSPPIGIIVYALNPFILLEKQKPGMLELLLLPLFYQYIISCLIVSLYDKFRVVSHPKEFSLTREVKRIIIPLIILYIAFVIIWGTSMGWGYDTMFDPYASIIFALCFFLLGALMSERYLLYLIISNLVFSMVFNLPYFFLPSLFVFVLATISACLGRGMRGRIKIGKYRALIVVLILVALVSNYFTVHTIVKFRESAAAGAKGFSSVRPLEESIRYRSDGTLTFDIMNLGRQAISGVEVNLTGFGCRAVEYPERLRSDRGGEVKAVCEQKEFDEPFSVKVDIKYNVTIDGQQETRHEYGTIYSI